MKTFYAGLLMLLMPLMASAQNATEQDGFADIVKAIKGGRASDLSAHLAESVEYEMQGQSNVYSRAQTIQVMKDFFNQNKAKSFSILHQSGRNQIKYIIGSYATIEGKRYRITCFVKQQGGAHLIQQIRIEDER